MENPRLEEKKEQTDKDERKKLYEQARRGIDSLFKSYGTGTERIEAIKRDGAEILKYLSNRNEIISSLDACAQIEDRNKFINEVFQAAKPIIDRRIDTINTREGTELKHHVVGANELVSYELKRDSIYINLLPEERVDKFLTKFKEGMQKIVEVLLDHPEIKTIRAESKWIIKKHSKIVSRTGFIIDDEENAHIDREDFLKKYSGKA